MRRTAVDRTIEITGRSTADIEIVLTPGGSIAGVVTGLPPSRLVDVEISAARLAERQTTSSDHAGAFALSNLATGEWTVMATSGDFAGPRTVKRTVTGGRPDGGCERALAGHLGLHLQRAEGGFGFEVGPNASRLLVSRPGYVNALVPLGIIPGQHFAGLVVELQPMPPEARNK